MTAVAHTEPVDRAAVLEQEVARLAKHGWTVVSRSDSQATLEKGKHTSHLLHFFLSLFTLGLWIPVWILVAVLSGHKTKLVTVGPDGRVR